MKRKTFLHGGLTLLVASTLCGCLLGGDNDETADMHLSISSAGTTASPMELVQVAVTGQNLGESRVVWGRGSSTCQFTAVVRIGKKFYPALAVRACTDDLAEQGLDPGESRDETWFWDGTVLVKNRRNLLPPGRYKLHAAAGEHVSRNSVTIEVVAP